NGIHALIAVEELAALVIAQNRGPLRAEQMPPRGGIIDIVGHLGKEIPLHVAVHRRLNDAGNLGIAGGQGVLGHFGPGIGLGIMTDEEHAAWWGLALRDGLGLLLAFF